MQKKIIWIGTYADDEYLSQIKENTYVQYAANRVQGYYIDALLKEETDIDVISALVTVPFPASKQIMLPYHKEEKGATIWNAPFLNVKYVSILSQTRALSKIFSRMENEVDFNDAVVIVYSMRIPYLKLAHKIKKKYPNVAVINIVPDLPDFMSTEKSLLRSVLMKYNKKTLAQEQKHVDGFVLYAEPMADTLNIPKEKYIIIEGLISVPEQTSAEERKANLKKICLYAGGVHKKYGVEALVQGFIEADIPDVELHVYGPGAYTEKISELSKTYPQLKYMGCVNPDEAYKKMKEADLLINPRSPEEEFTKYSCPSKTFEYMLSGTPVAMTRLSGIPKEYFDYVYPIENASKEGIAEMLKKVFAETDEERNQKAKSAKDFRIKNKNSDIQAKRLLEFAEKIKNAVVK